MTEAIAVLQEMQVFNVTQNDLVGGLPVGIGGMVKLKTLDLEINSFSGPPVIAEYVALTLLEEYWVGTNSLTGTVPGAIENWNDLRVLSLANNMITGTIPAQIGLLTELGTSY